MTFDAPPVVVTRLVSDALAEVRHRRDEADHPLRQRFERRRSDERAEGGSVFVAGCE